MPIPKISIGLAISPVLDKVSVSESGPKILVSPTPGIRPWKITRNIVRGKLWKQESLRPAFGLANEKRQEPHHIVEEVVPSERVENCPSYHKIMLAWRQQQALLFLMLLQMCIESQKAKFQTHTTKSENSFF